MTDIERLRSVLIACQRIAVKEEIAFDTEYQIAAGQLEIALAIREVGAEIAGWLKAIDHSIEAMPIVGPDGPRTGPK